jgi:hypothetical protein
MEFLTSYPAPMIVVAISAAIYVDRMIAHVVDTHAINIKLKDNQNINSY